MADFLPTRSVLSVCFPHCVLKTREAEQQRKSREINKSLSREKTHVKRLVKILLLGAGESGKSTFLKQMRIIHGQDFDIRAKEEFRAIIYSNVIKVLVTDNLHSRKVYDTGNLRQTHPSFLETMLNSSLRLRTPTAYHQSQGQSNGCENIHNLEELKSKMEFIEAELEKGYKEEAASMCRTLENITRGYLSRLQGLQKELTSANHERELAEQQHRDAQKDKERLLQENWQLLRALRHLRRSTEEHRRLQQQRKSRKTPLHITSWKHVHFPRSPQQHL
ncbi:uncharacterized protein LOC144824359 [Lissotriton helveticus]